MENSHNKHSLMPVETVEVEAEELNGDTVATTSSALAVTKRGISAGASPFRVVVDPTMREDLKRALFHLIDHHDEALAAYVSNGELSLDSYKEYIELFSRSLRETMESREGVLYLLRSVGINNSHQEEVNLSPEWRWK